MSKVKVTPEVLAAAQEIVGIVRHLVDHPDRFVVSVRPGTYRVAIELVTDPADVGQVVGRSGHIASSVRSFLAALSGKHKIHIDFDYVTEEDNKRREEEERSAAYARPQDHHCFADGRATVIPVPEVVPVVAAPVSSELTNADQ